MNRAATIWVEDYEGQDDDLPLSGETARNFAKALEADLVFCKKDGEAVSGLFLPGRDGAAAEVEKAHILYVSCHGTDDGPMLFGGNVAGYDKVVLGGGSLAYVVFDCCKVLGRAAQWRETFKGGLHYMLGFSGDVRQDASRGKLFAEFLRKGLTLPRAWECAATDTGMRSWVSIRAIREGSTEADEAWSRDTELAPDPGEPRKLVYLSHEARPESLPPQAERRNEVKVFSVRTATGRRSSARPLLRKLGFTKWKRRPWTDFIELEGGQGSLTLYEESDSFWWTLGKELEDSRAAAPGQMLFTMRRSLGKSMEFLESLDLPATVAAEPEVTLTRLVRESFDGTPLQDVQVEHHVHRRFELDGLPLMGPGAQLRVSLRGEVPSGVLVFWRNVEPEGVTVPVISCDQAAALLRSDRSYARLARGRVDLQGCALGYYSLPPRDRQDCLIPVYGFQVVVKRRTSDHRSIRYVQAVPEKVRNSRFPETSVMRTLPTVLP